MELATQHLAPPVNGADAEVERLTRAYGSEIFARLDRSGPILFSPSWWDDRLMEFTMGDEAVKLLLSRFIDAPPLLTSPPEISRHLREYFEEAGPALPGWVRRAVRWLPRRGWAGSLLASLARANARRLARRFI